MKVTTQNMFLFKYQYSKLDPAKYNSYFVRKINGVAKTRNGTKNGKI